MTNQSTDSTNNKSFIAIEGPIGVGKTTLAKKLAQSLGGELLLEGAQENPFLEKFYQDPKTGALPAQLFFLFQRTQQLKEIVQTDMFISNRIADFLMEKDRLFARVTLNEDELNLYEQVYQNLTIDAPKPDLVIYLQAPTDVLLKRIRKRGINMEFSITEDYLQNLTNAYTDFFHYYDASPLLIVNASGIDLVNNEAHYQQLLQRIEETNNGRNYFNPIIA
ncbi:deoxynucleoside kinase [Aliikangiella marina]|uniref:Deoxynucleoside kinase n=1 Tax=Aliikangiella marina TaxID=1712262 RepID=A0A545TC57_9GAMM|nr:deoxynucleoside kinase [Aliikangiella marina]TQV74802.1 deoxynucleoside kinase [Aliikangiella marina]